MKILNLILILIAVTQFRCQFISIALKPDQNQFPQPPLPKDRLIKQPITLQRCIDEVEEIAKLINQQSSIQN